MTGHTFGGSALDRHVFDFETVEADTADAAPVADAADVAPAGDIDAAPAEAAPAWTGPSQDEWEQTQMALQHYASLFSGNQDADPQADPGAQLEEAPEFDPFDPNSFKALLESVLDQRLAPLEQQAQTLEQQAQQAQQAANDELLKDAIHDTETRLGEFKGGESSRGQMIEVARNELAAMESRYGFVNDRMAEQALERAHAQVKQYETSIAEAAVKAFQNEMTTLAGARRELPANGATGLTATDRAGDELDLARRWGAA